MTEFEYTRETVTDAAGNEWTIRIIDEQYPENPQEWGSLCDFFIAEGARGDWGIHTDTLHHYVPWDDAMELDAIDAACHRDQDRLTKELVAPIAERWLALTEEQRADPRRYRNYLAECSYAESAAYKQAHSMANAAHHFERLNGGVALPLYGYDHSQRSISTGEFGCRYDSSTLGVVFLTRDRILAENGWKYITKRRREDMRERLKADVAVVNYWISNEVKAWVIEDENGDELDSMGGYYESAESVMAVVKGAYLADAIKARREGMEYKRTVKTLNLIASRMRNMFVAGVEDAAAMDRLMRRAQCNINVLPEYEHHTMRRLFIEIALG